MLNKADIVILSAVAVSVFRLFFLRQNPIKSQCIKIALQNELNVIVLANKKDPNKKLTRFDALS